MEKLYARALMQTIENGLSPSEAMKSLVVILKRQGRLALLPKIGSAFRRLAEARRAASPRLFIARDKDAAHAKKASGSSTAEVILDNTLIGGWRLEGGNEVIDRSFKKYLLDIYNSAITE